MECAKWLLAAGRGPGGHHAAASAPVHQHLGRRQCPVCACTCAFSRLALMWIGAFNHKWIWRASFRTHSYLLKFQPFRNIKTGTWWCITLTGGSAAAAKKKIPTKWSPASPPLIHSKCIFWWHKWICLGFGMVFAVFNSLQTLEICARINICWKQETIKAGTERVLLSLLFNAGNRPAQIIKPS